METVGPDRSLPLSSNNPYKTQDQLSPETPEALRDAAKEHTRSLDSDKQVVSSGDPGHDTNLPMVVDKEERENDTNLPMVVSKEELRNDASLPMVVSREELDEGVNSPMVVSKEYDLSSQPKPEREAGKEVMSSWQTKSKDESAPIPLYEERSESFQGQLLNDIKGEPPSYDSLNRRSGSDKDLSAIMPTIIEPDSPGAHLPARPEDRSAVGGLLSWMPPPPSKAASQMPPLLQPVIIPQLDLPPRGESVPFARCYSDFLSSHGIPIREFASFLDGLALAQSPNSALQGLKMFGAGVSAIPLPLIPLAGKGISALATSGSGHSGSQARLYLERAKKEYFEPRGLRLSIIKDLDLNPRLNIPTHAYRLAPLTNSTLNENISKRRLEGLAPYVAPLRYDMPEPDKQVSGVHRMARKHLEGKFKDQSRRLHRMREQQWYNITHNRMENQGWDERYKAKMSEVRSLQLDMIREQSSSKAMSGTLREMTQALDQLQKDVQLLTSERQRAMQNAINGHTGADAEMEEIDMSRRLKWIVIENLQ